ncbi:hypothetical protein DYB32_001517 [Aphanomyces invadans]|uniref:RanBP2-type domain-containing protein n=1 Tax=Aphanomyces invadans TaxID=157072 RepID=A0A418B613_9STRA|nr:hypothetical protein DYB32_001517 [Aphanomyces invadans]
MALYLQLGTAFLPPAPSLNPGLQYLKSVLYKDSTVEGSHVMREHLAAVEASQAAETLAREVKREGMELFRMAEEDATSSAFNYQDRIRAAAALEQYLQEQKAKYFDWTHQQKVRLVRDLESLHDVAAHQAKVHWTCVHCGTLNQRYMYACEFCGESSRMQGVEPVVESCSCHESWVKCEGHCQLLVERIAVALAAYPANPSVVYAAMSLAHSIVESTVDEAVVTCVAQLRLLLHHCTNVATSKAVRVVTVLQDDLNLENVTSIEARTSSIVSFRVEDEEMQGVLTVLQKLGVGVKFGFCDVMSLTPGTTISKAKKTKNGSSSRPRRGILQKSSDVGTAIPVAEIYAHIEASTTLSRDSIGMLFISSYVITLLLGMLLGIVLAPYADDLKWPTAEMRSRGQAVSLIFGAIVAALSGAGVALAESNANISSVVGTAIAAALLPPTVNCGISLSYAIIGPLFLTDYEVTKKNVFFEIAVGSALLVWINIIFIYLSAVVVFKFKQVDKFELVRNVDESTWQNLPKLGKTPRMRDHALPPNLCREDVSSDGTSSPGILPQVSTVQGDSAHHLVDLPPPLPTTAMKRRIRSVSEDDNDSPLAKSTLNVSGV